MQKLYDIRQGRPEDFDSLKNLWQESFGDETEAINNFFSETVVPENIIGVFCGNKALSALYIVECEAVIDKKSYSAFYVYGVSTDSEYRKQGLMRQTLSLLEKIAEERKADYLFLVPATESLFSMYEKFGYKVGITYLEKEYNNPCFNMTAKTFPVNYDCYKKLREKSEFSHIDLKEKGFRSFFNPKGDSIKCISIPDKGYCVYEKEDGVLTVHELFGNREVLLSAVFCNEKCEKITVREYSENSGIPFGMYKAIGDAPEFKNVFFGIPYGG